MKSINKKTHKAELTNTSIHSSKYNYFLKNGKVLNLVSGSLIELQPKQLSGLEENDYTHFSSEELEKLIKMGFVIHHKNEDRFYNNLRKKEYTSYISEQK